MSGNFLHTKAALLDKSFIFKFPSTLFCLRCHTSLEFTSATLSFSPCVTASCCSVRNLFPVMRVEVDWGHSQRQGDKERERETCWHRVFQSAFSAAAGATRRRDCRKLCSPNEWKEKAKWNVAHNKAHKATCAPARGLGRGFWIFVWCRQFPR